MNIFLHSMKTPGLVFILFAVFGQTEGYGKNPQLGISNFNLN